MEEITFEQCMPKSRMVSPPSTGEIREARAKSGLTQAAAAELVYSRRRTWEDWEGGISRMHPAIFELFVVKTSGTPERKAEMSKTQSYEETHCYLPGVRFTNTDGDSVVGMLSLERFNSKDAAKEAATSIIGGLAAGQFPGGNPWAETEAEAYPATIRSAPDGMGLIVPDYEWAKSGGRAV